MSNVTKTDAIHGLLIVVVAVIVGSGIGVGVGSVLVRQRVTADLAQCREEVSLYRHGTYPEHWRSVVIDCADGKPWCLAPLTNGVTYYYRPQR